MFSRTNISYLQKTKRLSVLQRIAVLCFVLLALCQEALHAQVISNNGAAISISSGTVINNVSDVNNVTGSTITNAGTLNLTGNWTNNGTPSAGSGIVNFGGTSTQTIGGTSSTTFGTLQINNSVGVTLGIATTVTTLTIGNVTTNSIFNDGGYQLTSTGTLNLTSGNFKLGSVGTGTTFPAFATSTISAGTTVEYASGVAQTVASAPNYQNLTISGTGTKSLQGTTNIAGDLTISAGTFDLGSYTANRTSAGGTLTLSATASLRIGGTNTIPSNYSTHSFGATSTVEFYGSNQSVVLLNSGQNYGNIIITNAGSKTFATGLTANGDVTVNTGATMVVTGSLHINGNLSINGAITNNGTINIGN